MSEFENETPSIALTRDHDGYVHTPSGFLSERAYRLVWAENLDLLPAYEDIPLA